MNHYLKKIITLIKLSHSYIRTTFHLNKRLQPFSVLVILISVLSISVVVYRTFSYFHLVFNLPDFLIAQASEPVTVNNELTNDVSYPEQTVFSKLKDYILTHKAAIITITCFTVLLAIYAHDPSGWNEYLMQFYADLQIRFLIDDTISVGKLLITFIDENRITSLIHISPEKQQNIEIFARALKSLLSALETEEMKQEVIARIVKLAVESSDVPNIGSLVRKICLAEINPLPPFSGTTPNP